jgi:hypothetical protein
MANIQAEKLLLAGLTQNPDTYFELTPYLDTDTDFTSAGSRMTYDVLGYLYMELELQKVTRSKILAGARALGLTSYMQETRNGEALDDILAESVDTLETKRHFQEVKRHSYIKGLMLQMQEVRDYVGSTDEPLSKIIATVEDKLVSTAGILDGNENAPVRITEGLKDFIYSFADDPGHIGLDMGFAVWQSRVGQIRNGSVTFIAGTTKSGKSQLGVRAAIIAAHRHGIPVFLVDSELNQNDQKIRLAGMLAEVPYNILETGYWKLSREELVKEGIEQECEIEKIIEYGKRMAVPELWELADRLPVHYLSISGMGVQEVIPHLRRWVLTHVKPDREAKVPQCLIVYDYIKLANVEEIKGGKIPEWQLHGLNVAALHDFATRYHVPIITFGQTNNVADDGLQCIAGGKRISENVTSISYIKRKSDEERSMDPNGTHYIKVFAARYGGSTGESGYVNYNVDLSCGVFEEIGMGTVNFAEERARRRQEAQSARRGNNDDD